MIAGIAWRNIWRNWKRSAVIISAIALGLAGGIFAVGIWAGMAESMVETSIDRNLAHLQLHTPAFKTNAVLGHFIPNGEADADSIEVVPGVTAVSPRAVVDGMASSAVTNRGVRILGVSPEKEERTCSVARHIVEGTYFDSTSRNPIVIGKTLAEKLELRLHSKIVLSFPGRDGSVIYGSFRIVGIFQSESSVFDQVTLFVRQADLTSLLGAPVMVHEIAVRLQSGALVPGLKTELAKRFPSLTVESWQDLAPELKLTAEVTDITMIFFLGIILFALMFGITNTMLMSVLDRVREFGVLMAIGMKRGRVFSLILLETMYLSFTGGLLGALGGAGLVAVFARSGIDLSGFAAGLSLYGIPCMLYPSVPVNVYWELAILVMITAVAAALYPGLKATRLNPARAIRAYM